MMNIADNPHLHKNDVRRSFLLWVGKYNPDFVSRRVLGLLIEKYGMGEKEALFAKMKQLEGDEHYELCTMFKSMFDSMNLNKEYLRWAKKLRLTVSGLAKLPNRKLN
jgi:hypothetical protein